MQALNGFQVEDHQTWQVVPLGIREVKVTDLLYSQTSISDHFQDGSPIHRLVADLKSGTVHPLQLRPLRVIDRPGRGLVTLDHRLRTPDRLTGTGPQLCSRGLEPQ